MIGKIYRSITLYYDSRIKKTTTKSRPVLILSTPRNNDYTILPISTITKKQNLDFEYDVELNPDELTNLKLNKISYVRTHKRIYIHSADLDLSKDLGDIKTCYPELYKDIIERMEKYNSVIKEECLK